MQVCDSLCNLLCNNHCVKNVRIRRFAGPYFPAFGLNTEIYTVSLRIQSECGKIWTRKTLNTDIFHPVNTLRVVVKIYLNLNQELLFSWGN